MKVIAHLFLSGLALCGVMGCREVYAPVPCSPDITIHYIDKPENDFIKEFIKNNPDEENLFELISISDKEGNVVEASPYSDFYTHQPAIIRFFPEIQEHYTSNTPFTEREYTIRYKAPFLFGDDRIEEVKLIYKVEYYGEFTHVWYNAESVKISDKTFQSTEEATNYYYNGEGIKVTAGASSFINIIIPIGEEDIAK